LEGIEFDHILCIILHQHVSWLLHTSHIHYGTHTELCETYIQVGWQFGVRVLATCKSYESIITSPKSRECFIVNYIDIITNKLILDFYIFKGESVQKDYIRLFKQGTCITTWKNVWMPSFLFKEFPTSLQKVRLWWHL
jgi:hypothetical protein